MAVGRLIIDPKSNSAEFAILLHDLYQRKGVAHKLREMLISIGREKDLEQIVGRVLTTRRCSSLPEAWGSVHAGVLVEWTALL